MNQILKKYRYYLLLFFTVFLFQSCKTDEFKFRELTIKEDWGTNVVTPLFSGKVMEFRDFVYDWKKQIPDSSGPFTVLDYLNSPDKTIPTDLIFTPSAVIDSFPFYIQGPYYLSKVDLEFIVVNSCPFPLNLKLEFFSKSNRNKLGPPILAGPFKESDNIVAPPFTKTTQRIPLDSLQLHSFNNSDRMKFTSWFEPTEFISQNDSISAHYPIDISIVLIGVVQGKNEE
jgi:hypothetical protein